MIIKVTKRQCVILIILVVLKMFLEAIHGHGRPGGTIIRDLMIHYDRQSLCRWCEDVVLDCQVGQHDEDDGKEYKNPHHGNELFRAESTTSFQLERF